jgi:hypothetical protein
MDAPAPLGPGRRVPRRIATTPISLHARHQADAPPTPQSSALVETLYYHPNIKIISFTASARAISRSPTRGGDGARDEVGTLSWSSQLERTIAVGPFRIYRAPGSVAFLNCGSALQPILPKSQSWCLDEANSRFVLQIRRPNYWRLELPVEGPENQQLAHALRGVLDKVLQFEKTPCPFKRTFTVHLPEPPQEPVKKKPWKPVRRSLPDVAVVPTTPTTPTGRPIDAAVIYTAPTVERTLDDSPSTPSTLSMGSNTSDSSPAVSSLGRSAGLAVLAQKARAVSEGTPTVPNLVKQFNQHIVYEAPIAPQEDIPISVPSTPDPDETQKAETVPMKKADDAVTKTKAELVSESEPVQEDTSHTSNTQTKAETLKEALPIRPQSERKHSGQQKPTVEHPARDAPDTEELVSGSSNLELHEGAGRQTAQRKVRLRRSTGFGSMRLSSAPVRPLSIVTTTAASATPAPAAAEESGNVSPTESEDSFHSVESWHAKETVLPPSPPISQADSKAKVSDTTSDTVSDNASDTSEYSAATAPDDKPLSVPDEDSILGENDLAWIATQYLDVDRTRAKDWPSTNDTSLRRRALSPLPAAATIFSPPIRASRALIYNNRLEIMRKIPMAIISKTCSMVLGPPLHLLTLMLKVAAKISAGQSRGQEYGYGMDGEQIPVQWDYSDGDISDWDEDAAPTPTSPRRG